MLFDLILLLHSQNSYSGEFEIAGGKACTPSTSGMQGSLTWLHQSHVSFSPLRSLAPSWRIQMFRNGEMSMVWMDVQSPFCVWRVHRSCENGGFPSVQTKGSVEGEIAVIHALGRIFLHGLRKRVQQAPACRLPELFM